MKIIAISDTHGNIDAAERVIRRVQPDTVIHLGDCVSDAERLMALFPGIPFECVPGNNDYTSHLPFAKTVPAEGAIIYITHGHKFSVKLGTSALLRAAATVKADIALYGHTHTPSLRQVDGIWLMCPGTAKHEQPRKNNTCGMIEIIGGKIQCKIMEI